MINITSGIVSLAALTLLLVAIIVGFLGSRLVKKYGLAARIISGIVIFYLTLQTLLIIWEKL